MFSEHTYEKFFLGRSLEEISWENFTREYTPMMTLVSSQWSRDTRPPDTEACELSSPGPTDLSSFKSEQTLKAF